MAEAFKGNLQKPYPMALHYNTNHGGRDSYIYADNGGFMFGDYRRSSCNDGGPGTMRQYKSFKGPDPARKYSPARSKPIHYHVNGGGRDTYIGITNGGFMSPPMSNSGKDSFMKQLRTYDRIENRSMNRSPSLRSVSPDGTNSPSRAMEEYSNPMCDHFQIGQGLIADKRMAAALAQT